MKGEHEGISGMVRPPASVLRPTSVRYQVLAVACSLAVLTYVQRQGFVAGTPFIKQDLGLNDQEVGLLASVWLIAYGIFQVPGGLLGDRIGARHLLTLLVLGWSLLVGTVALAPLLPAGWLLFAFLLVVRFLFGGFQAGGFPALARVVADWIPSRQRGFAQGMVWTFSRLGGFAAPLLVLWLIRGFGGWETPLWLLAGLGWLWCLAFWLWFRNRPEEHPAVNAAELGVIKGAAAPALDLSAGAHAETKNEDERVVSAVVLTGVAEKPAAPAGATSSPSRRGVPWLRFLASPSVWGLCLLYGFGGFAGNFITSLLPVYLRDHRRLSDETTAWLSGLPLAFGVVSCLTGGVLSDWLIRQTGNRKWGRRLVGLVSFALAAVATLSIVWVEQAWLLGLVFSAMFFFNDANMGPAWASCADVGERYAGTLSGAMNMTGAFFGAVGMALAGACFHRHYDAVVFVVFACSYVLAALCWLLVDVTRPIEPKSAQA
jgi:ACS family glucarate transporter-like MFS transporter